MRPHLTKALVVQIHGKSLSSQRHGGVLDVLDRKLGNYDSSVAYLHFTVCQTSDESDTCRANRRSKGNNIQTFMVNWVNAPTSPNFVSIYAALLTTGIDDVCTGRPKLTIRAMESHLLTSAREIVIDHPLPWQKLIVKLTPGRVAQSMAGVLAAIGTPSHSKPLESLAGSAKA